uniref:Uncharacterized protein n=1 Tax=Rhizophora mucronata TaxID=61149 RepID=A0A2P2NKU9_RHIMU
MSAYVTRIAIIHFDKVSQKRETDYFRAFLVLQFSFLVTFLYNF